MQGPHCALVSTRQSQDGAQSFEGQVSAKIQPLYFVISDQNRLLPMVQVTAWRRICTCQPLGHIPKIAPFQDAEFPHKALFVSHNVLDC